MSLYTALLRVILGKITFKLFGNIASTLDDNPHSSTTMVTIGVIVSLIGIGLYANGIYHAIRILTPYLSKITY